MKSLSTIINRAIAATGVPVDIRITSTSDGFTGSLQCADSGEVITLKSDWERRYSVSNPTVEGSLLALDLLAAEDLAACDGIEHRITVRADEMKAAGHNWPSVNEFYALYGVDATPADCADYLSTFNPRTSPLFD